MFPNPNEAEAAVDVGAVLPKPNVVGALVVADELVPKPKVVGALGFVDELVVFPKPNVGVAVEFVVLPNTTCWGAWESGGDAAVEDVTAAAEAAAGCGCAGAAVAVGNGAEYVFQAAASSHC